MKHKPILSSIIIVFLILLCTLNYSQSSIAIAEYMPVNRNSRENKANQFMPWIKLQNTKNVDVQLALHSLLFVSKNNTKLVQLPDYKLFAGESILIWIANCEEIFQSEGVDRQILVDDFIGDENIYIVDNQLLNKIDSIILPSVLEDGLVIGKTFFGQSSTHIYPYEFSNFDLPTTYLPNFQKISSRAAFPPADSDPNACVNYKGKIWIFGGWGFDSSSGGFKSTSYIWSSVNGIDWEESMTDLPYSHYSSFIVFNDTIWIYTNFNIFSSTDGINWQNRGETPYPFFGEQAIMKVLNNKLYFVEDNKSGYSYDGLNFTISNHSIPPRFWGSLQHIGNDLFFFGGQNIASGDYYNDVWKSSDGLNWQKITSSAQWISRKWFMSFSFLDYMWIFGGYNANNLNENNKANMNDIWYSKNGIDWLPYQPLNNFSIRHAAYHTQKDGKIWILGGFDNYENTGFFNDVWTFAPNSLFLKEGQSPELAASWTFAPGNGPSPKDLNDVENTNLYVSGHLSNFFIPASLINKNNSLFIGNGFDSATCTISSHTISNIPLYISSNSNITFDNTVIIPEFIGLQNSTIKFTNFQNLQVPNIGYWNLQIKNSKVSKLSSISVRGNLLMDDINLPKLEDGVNIRVLGNLTLGKFHGGFRNIRIEGTSLTDQVIKTTNNGEIIDIDKLNLKKQFGNFILKGQFKVLDYLMIDK